MREGLTDHMSYYLSIVAFFASWLLLSWETGEVFQSIFAAILTAAIFWVSYILVRWLVLAIKN